ncbi:hypothetical protein D0N36_16235 [Hymenobacter lapidiphilus]|nr:hypothetical protein D0N36_16235 [Hymenobacter sp. CCM 8763]
MNIAYVIQLLNRTGYVDLIPDAYNYAFVQSGDFTIDIITEESPEVYLKLIRAMYTGVKYRKEEHSRNQNITFYYCRGKSTPKNVHFKIYDKTAKDKRNIVLKNTLRFELRLNSYKKIRTHLMLSENNAVSQDYGLRKPIPLMSVLNSKENPVFNIYKDITQSIYQYANTITATSGVYSPATVTVSKPVVFRATLTSRKELERYSLLKEAEYDLDNLYSIIKPVLKSKPGKPATVKPYGSILASYQLFRAGLQPQYSMLMELYEKLQNGILKT